MLDSHVLAAEQVAGHDHHKHWGYSFAMGALVDLVAAPGRELTCNAGMVERRKTWAQALVSSAGTETVMRAAVICSSRPVRILKEALAHLSETDAVGAAGVLLTMPVLESLVLPKDAEIPKPVGSAEEGPVLPWEAEVASYCLVAGYQKAVLGGQTMARRYRGYLSESHGSLKARELGIAVPAAR